MSAEIRCSWCGALLKDGSLPVSHGICQTCQELYFPETLDVDRPRERDTQGSLADLQMHMDLVHGKNWQRNVCRCCRVRVGQSMHELLPRSLGGKVSRKNSVWVCGDGVQGCHGFLQRHEIKADYRELGAEGPIYFLPNSQPARDWLRVKDGERIESELMQRLEAAE